MSVPCRCDPYLLLADDGCCADLGLPEPSSDRAILLGGSATPKLGSEWPVGQYSEVARKGYEKVTHLMLTPRILHRNRDPGWDMSQSHGRLCLVDMLQGRINQRSDQGGNKNTS